MPTAAITRATTVSTTSTDETGGPGRRGDELRRPSHVSSARQEAWRLAWPLILSNLTVPLLGIADTAVVGHLDEPHHLAAVAAGATTFNVLYFACVSLRMATTGLAAQALGRGEGDEVRVLLARGLVLAAGLALILLLCAGPIVAAAVVVFDPSAPVAESLESYLQVRLLGAPAGLANMVLLGWLLGLQNARGPMILMIATNALNIGLDVLFVTVLGLAAGGVAAATAIAEYSGLVLGIVLVRRELRRLPGALGPLARITRLAGFRRLLAVNRDIFLRSLALQAGFLSFAVISSRLGEVTLAANAILLSLQSFASFGLDGFAHATEAMVGRHVGARNRAAFKAAIRANFEFALVLAVVLSLGFGLAGSAVIRGMTTIEDVRALALDYLPYMVISPLISVWAFLFDGVFIGATRTGTMRDGMILACLVFVLGAALLVPAFGNHGLWVTFLTFMSFRGVWLGGAYLLIEAGPHGFVGARSRAGA